MSGARKIEHATIEVTDLEASTEFYTDVLGLVELERRDGTVYLGCGLDENYDLGLVEGKTGVEHAAIRLDDVADLEGYERRLDEAGVETTRTDGDEPGQEAGLRFSLPSGIDLELVTVADADYHHPVDTIAGRDRIAPLDLDHLNFMTYDVDADRAFLVDHLDFAVSDEIVGETGFTVQAWLRRGEWHHDVALSTANAVPTTLHHVAFEMENLEHVKAFCDRFAADGYQLEMGPSRHNAGANVFAYFWAPGGNRVELCAELATVDAGAETGTRELTREENTVSRWGGVVPNREFTEKGS